MSTGPGGHTPTASRSRDHAHRVPRGMPSYRPVRSPLQSMGPSLLEERRRRRAVLRAAAVAVGAATVVAALAFLVVFLSQEVVSDAPVAPATDAIALPVGRPEPLALARIVEPEGGSDRGLKLSAPIHARAVTAIGYDSMTDPKVLELAPEGSRANLSFGQRLFRRFLATAQPTSLRYFELAPGGARLKRVNIGAMPGTDVYAPISGTIIAISDNVIDDEARGVVVQVQPLGDAETVVVMRNIDLAEGVSVGQTISEGATMIGTVRDMDGAIRQRLSKYTHDDGSNLEIYVRRVQADPVF